MKPYARIRKTVDHECPDRIPIDFVATPEIKKHLGIYNDETLLRRLGVDIH